MINVVHLLPHLDSQTGGMERQALQVAKALSKKNCNVVFVTCADWTRMKRDRLRSIDQFGGIPIYRIPTIRGWRLTNAFLFLFGGIVSLITLRRRYTIVHAHQIHTSGIITGVLKSLLPSKSAIVKNPGGGAFGDLQEMEKFWGHSILKGFLLRMIDVFVGVSEETVNEMADAGFQRVKLIPNGVNTKLFVPVSAEEKLEIRRAILGPVAHDYVAVFVGRLGPEKNLLVLLDAIAEIELDVFLLVVGEGAQREEVQRYVRTKKIQQRVAFWGTVNDVHRFYQMADVFVLPSLSEGLPNTLLEAMSCGIPSVGSNINSIRSVIDHKHNGYLFKTDESQDLAEAMTKILTDPHLARFLSVNARKIVEERFSLDHVAHEYVRLYESLDKASLDRM